MTKAVRVHELGGPDVLCYEDVVVGAPAGDEALVRHTAIGLNFIDVYFRTGLYPAPLLPFTPGLEAAGVVEAVGADVEDLRPGQRVAYACRPLGAYSEARCMPAKCLVPLPPAVSDEQAAALMLKGMTAQYLLRRTHRVVAGETILVHAAAGGVGLLLCQWASHLGARVIGTVGSEDKAQRARAAGCAETILYKHEDFVARVRELTDGAGLPVVYDSVGRDTFMGSLDCLAPFGLLVSFGQSSGPVAAFDLLELTKRGSLFVTRPSLMDYVAAREDLVRSASELFDMLEQGVVQASIGQRFPLREAAQAHRLLEGRGTHGATLLTL